MNAHYPSDYPDGFEEKLIAAGAKTQTITPVYRILYDGKLNAFNFESTYINYRRRHKTLTKRKLQNEGRESPRFQPWDDRPTIMVFFVFANIIVM